MCAGGGVSSVVVGVIVVGVVVVVDVFVVIGDASIVSTDSAMLNGLRTNKAIMNILACIMQC